MASTSKNQGSTTKHKIFLSHSGKQKDFVKQLFLDLKSRRHSPFFDQCPQSLPKGEEFPPLIFDAARQCELAVVVLSEDFVTTKWPMMELVEFVKTSRKILPLFYKLSVRDLSDPEKLEQWKLTWEKFAGERINSADCEHALKKVRNFNGLVKEASMSEVTYLKSIVESICNRIPVEPLYYVSDVQGRDRLCEEVHERFEKISQSCSSITGACVLGIYGIGGTGKTTMCLTMCNFYRSLEFPGSSCHIALPLPMEKKSVSILEALKGALRVLTQAEESLLNGLMDIRQAQEVLMERARMKRQKVFLAIDNVWYENMEEARFFLSLPFESGSRILVTARSSGILQDLLEGCDEKCFLHMPGLEKREAIGMLKDYAAGGFSRPCTRNFSAEEESFFGELVDRWKPGGRKSSEASHIYHPLLLKALGYRLKKGGLSVWKDDRLLSQPGLKSLGIASKEMISILRINYDELPSEDDKHIFLDVALFLPPGMATVEDVCGWLSVVHSGSSSEDIMLSVNLCFVLDSFNLNSKETSHALCVNRPSSIRIEIIKV